MMFPSLFGTLISSENYVDYIEATWRPNCLPDWSPSPLSPLHYQQISTQALIEWTWSLHKPPSLRAVPMPIRGGSLAPDVEQWKPIILGKKPIWSSNFYKVPAWKKITAFAVCFLQRLIQYHFNLTSDFVWYDLIICKLDSHIYQVCWMF